MSILPVASPCSTPEPYIALAEKLNEFVPCKGLNKTIFLTTSRRFPTPFWDFAQR